MATANTIIPIPPIQCVKLRQNNTPFGTISISFKIEAPVVVNPDMVSKKAFVILGIAPVAIYGIAPDKDITIHPKDTTI